MGGGQKGGGEGGGKHAYRHTLTTLLAVTRLHGLELLQLLLALGHHLLQALEITLRGHLPLLGSSQGGLCLYQRLLCSRPPLALG